MKQDSKLRNIWHQESGFPWVKKCEISLLKLSSSFVIGLCFGQNAIILGKTNFPYNEAAVRSILLWHKLTNATVAITIVHNNKYTSDSLKKYAQELEDLGASVVVHHEDVLHCVLTSQIVRLVNVHLHDDIEPDDVVITADVDAFIMNPALLKPLDHHNVSAWVWRYGLSLSSGFTFAMSFVGKSSVPLT